MPEEGISTVLVTFPTRESAESMAERLLEARLIACANLFPVRSVYRWQGKLEREEEWMALLKIRTERFEMVRAAILEVHPYEVPCIVRYDVNEGHVPYLDWVRESTAPPPGD